MGTYFKDIISGFWTFMQGLGMSWHHFVNKKTLVATLQYPHEKWPIEDRNIGFDLQEYNVIRSRLHVDIDDCIGCNQCMRACPVDCIAIESVKPPKGSEFDPGMTVNGTQKKMLVARFDIDLTECMYCNLCVYPCPEDCIYMVGGPNSSKHEIDYEFAKRDRNDLIFKFATATEEEVIAAGGQSYLNKKNGIVEEIPVEKKAVVKKAAPAEPKINFESVNVIEDRMTRSLAKKAFTAAVREGKDASDTSQTVKAALEEAGKYTAELDSVIANIAASELMSTPASAEPAVEKPADDGLTVKVLNDITDRMSRGTAKKAFMAAQREGKDPAGIAAAVTSAVTEAGKMTDEVQEVINKISASGSAEKKAPAAVKPATDDGLTVKVLNDITDRMTRGTAKKAFMAAQREGKDPAGIAAAVTSAVTEAGKMTDDVQEVINKISASGSGEKKAPAAAKPSSASELDIKVLNAIDDKMTRGLAKKTFLGAKREGKADAEIVESVKSVIDEAGKLDDETAAVINSLLGNG